MKGLDGIQGPIYVGTGCVFRRLALYGYDAPKAKKPPTRTCNCLPKWCCCGCCCSGKKKKKKTTKPKTELKKKYSKKGDAAAPPPLEGIEEGIEGEILLLHEVPLNCLLQVFLFLSLNVPLNFCINRQEYFILPKACFLRGCFLVNICSNWI